MDKFRHFRKRTSFNLISNLSPTNVFCLLSIVSLLTLLMCFMVSKGEFISRYFFYDIRDSGMDFFHSIEYVKGRKPYTDWDVLYPPLANFIFYFFFYLIPRGVSANWPSDFLESVYIRGTDFDLRTYQAPFLIFVFYTILITCFFIFVIVLALNKFSYTKANCVAICMLFSYGVMFAIDRGNIIWLIFPLVLFFANFVDSNNNFVRELALLSLAAAIGIKLYPSFFSVLLIHDRKYKEFGRLVLYSIIFIIVPFFFFKDDFYALFSYFHKLLFTATSDTSYWLNLDFMGILSRMVLYAKVYLGLDLSIKFLKFIKITSLAISFIFTFYFKKVWQKILFITVAMILFHTQPEYILGWIVVPLVLFLKEEDNLTKANVIPFLLMTLLTIHLPLFYTYNVSYPNIAIKQLLLLLLFLWCLVMSMIKLYRNLKYGQWKSKFSRK